MRNSRQSSVADPLVRRHRPDYGLVILASLLLVIGLIVMFSISPALAALGGGVSDNYYVFRQFIAIIMGCLAFVFVAKLPLKTWERWQTPILVIALILCVAAVAVAGGKPNRWLQLGTLSFQPVEFVKFSLVVIGASFMARLVKEGNITNIKSLRPLLVVFALFGFVLVILQRDLGSPFVLFSMAAIMAFVAGIPLKRIVIFSIVAVLFGIAATSTTAYRRERLMTFVQPERDCVDSGYHACQALIAVGSGGVFGLGLGRSVQAYGYLPEAANDSIFAIYAEKFGFVGVIVLLGIFGALLFRILAIMQRAPNRASQLMVAGVFAWFAVQAFVNIGAMIGILPLKGITLPFISYGGTSIIFSMAALGIVFQISGYTSMRKSVQGYDDERIVDENNRHWRRDSRPRYTITRSRI